jgi:hypothetical protein
MTQGLPEPLRELEGDVLLHALDLLEEVIEVRASMCLPPPAGHEFRRIAQLAKDWARMKAVIALGEPNLENNLRAAIKQAEVFLLQPKGPTAAQLRARAGDDIEPDEPGDFGELRVVGDE